MTQRIVGLVGPHGSGKTEVAKFLVAKYGFERVHLGLAVKRALRDGFGLTDLHVDGDLIDKPCDSLGGATPRHALEAMGEAAHRAAPGSTAIAWEREVRTNHNRASILADGIRRVTEADAVRRLGGIVIRISRPGVFDESLPCDVMQREVQADHEIINDSDVMFLHRWADRIVSGYLYGETATAAQ